MVRVQVAVLATLVSLLAGCGGAPAVHYGSEANPAADFSTLRSYSFAHRTERPPTGFHRVHVGTEIMERRIERALHADLTAKGFNQVPREEADFVVFYALGARDVVEGAPADGGSGWQSSMVNAHGQAAIIVDFVQASDGEHLWHGYAEGAVGGEQVDFEQAITAVIDGIIARFDPPPAAPTAGGEAEPEGEGDLEGQGEPEGDDATEGEGDETEGEPAGEPEAEG